MSEYLCIYIIEYVKKLTIRYEQFCTNLESVESVRYKQTAVDFCVRYYLFLLHICPMLK